MKKIHMMIGFLGVCVLVVSFVFFFRLGGSSYGQIAKLLAYFSSAIAVIYGLASLKYFGFRTTQGKSIFCITAFLGLWLIGDISWYYFGEIFSYADIFYFLGYFMFFIGIYFGMKTINNDFLKERRKIIFLLAFFLIAALAYFKFVSIIKPMSFAEDMIGIIYSVFDFILLICVIFIVSEVFGGSYSSPWLVIGTGALVSWAADIIYYFFIPTTQAGDLIFLIYIYAYFIFAYGFALLENKAEEAISATQNISKIAGKKK